MSKLDVFSSYRQMDSLSIVKSNDEKNSYYIEGIATSEHVDSSGEIIIQDGIDWSYALKSGVFNLDHKNDPENVLGNPESISKIKLNGVPATIVRGMLYGKKKIVKDLIENVNAMKSANAKRKLGFSIEGQVIARDPRNPKIITKAKVLNISLTHNPCNTEATVELVKNILSNIHESEEIKTDNKGDNMIDEIIEKADTEHADIPMTLRQAIIIEEYSNKLLTLLRALPEDFDLPEWIQSKITKASDDIHVAFHNLEIEVREKVSELNASYRMQKEIVTEGDEDVDVDLYTEREDAESYDTATNPLSFHDKDDVSKEEGSLAPLVEESLEGKKDDDDDDESIDELASESYELSDEELKLLVTRILSDYPELSDRKVMQLIHRLIARQ